jgi:TM2 domain-containing membrane protein YozV
VIVLKRLLTPPSAEEAKAQNMIAVVLSILAPGLGHIYKGHFAAGFIWMFVGIPLALWIGLLFSLATGGIGLIFPLACWTAVAVDAYSEKDRRRSHHWLTADGVEEDFSASID